MKTLNILLLFCVMRTILTIDRQKLFTSENNSTYYIEQEYKYTWFEAFLECSMQKMALVTLQTKDKHEDIAQILMKEDFTHHAPHLWVGAVGENRQFSWIFNSQPLFTNKWIAGNPDNYNNDENCIHFWENTTMLNDRKCDLKYGFICEAFQIYNEANNNNQPKFKNIIINFKNNN